MATILWEHAVFDGYNVACLLGSTKRILHFLNTPTTEERDASIAAAETRIAEELAAAEIEANMAEVLE